MSSSLRAATTEQLADRSRRLDRTRRCCPSWPERRPSCRRDRASRTRRRPVRPTWRSPMSRVRSCPTRSVRPARPIRGRPVGERLVRRAGAAGGLPLPGACPRPAIRPSSIRPVGGTTEVTTSGATSRGRASRASVSCPNRMRVVRPRHGSTPRKDTAGNSTCDKHEDDQRAEPVDDRTRKPGWRCRPTRQRATVRGPIATLRRATPPALRRRCRRRTGRPTSRRATSPHQRRRWPRRQRATRTRHRTSAPPGRWRPSRVRSELE